MKVDLTSITSRHFVSCAPQRTLMRWYGGKSRNIHGQLWWQSRIWWAVLCQIEKPRLPPFFFIFFELAKGTRVKDQGIYVVQRLPMNGKWSFVVWRFFLLGCRKSPRHQLSEQTHYPDCMQKKQMKISDILNKDLEWDYVGRSLLTRWQSRFR